MQDEAIERVFSSYRHQNANGFAVAQMTDRTMVVGELAGHLLGGVSYLFHGRWQNDEKYGKRFKAKSFRQSQIHTSHGVTSYLSKFCLGVGPVTAGELYTAFGPDAVRVLRTDPKLACSKVKRLRPAIAEAAANALSAQAKYEAVHIDLTDLLAGRGFQQATIDAAMRKWKLFAAEHIRRDPFKMLVEGFPGCGFARCDRLYQDLGLPLGRTKRQLICVWNALRSDSSGSTWLPKQKAIDALYASIGAGVVLKPEKALKLGLRSRWLAARKDSDGNTWIADGDKAADEYSLAKKLREMREKDEGGWLDCSKLSGVSPHQRERAAITTSASVGILNGGPGVGKSFTLAEILKLARKKFGDMIAVCSPTGKAATRLTQAMLACGVENVECTTVHRLLKPTRSGHEKGGKWGFIHCEDNLLPHDLICVEEASMLSTGLAADLFSALKTSCKIILVGDARQLPPIDHGRPLLDLIDAGYPCGTLTEIKRNSGDGNRICDDINAGRKYEPSTTSDWENGANCFHFQRSNTADQIRALRMLYENLPQQFNSVDDVQVLAIINENSPVSRKPLNEMLQALLNKDGAPAGTTGLRIGDKVCNLENGNMLEAHCGACGDASIGSVIEYHGGLTCLRCGGAVEDRDESYIANGECGKVIDSGGAGVHVLFDWPRRVHRFVGEQCKRLELAYCLSVHKSQGSQWPVVVFMLDDSHGAAMVAGRQLALTAMSRYEKLTATIGKKSVLDGWVQRDLLGERRTFLKEMLSKCAN